MDVAIRSIMAHLVLIPVLQLARMENAILSADIALPAKMINITVIHVVINALLLVQKVVVTSIMECAPMDVWMRSTTALPAVNPVLLPAQTANVMLLADLVILVKLMHIMEINVNTNALPIVSMVSAINTVDIV